jgi:hypothetical protein
MTVPTVTWPLGVHTILSPKNSASLASSATKVPTVVEVHLQKQPFSEDAEAESNSCSEVTKEDESNMTTVTCSREHYQSLCRL